MAVDAELIGSEGFNLKFKNYLRDFYIYQFKERGSDFKIKGTNDKKDLNKDIIDGTFYPDTKRLQFALEKSAGVTWSKGDYVDIPNGRINKKRENKRVECITIDSRRLERNPFFSLYSLCSESALTPGTHFSFVYTLLLYFQLGKKVKRTDYTEISKEENRELNQYLIGIAENIESEVRRHKPKLWDNFSENDKAKFASEAIERFSKDHFGLEKIYRFMLLNKMKIVYSDGLFKLENDGDAFIEKGVLFDALSLYGVEIEEKQFGNKMQELSRMGIVKMQKRGQRIYYGLGDFLFDIVEENEDFLQRLSDCVAFFKQISILGEAGEYIQNRLLRYNAGYMRFKHNYIKRTLNDYNNVDLLYAIENNLWAVIEYRNASLNDLEYQKILCYPIEIRESVTDGRQYLIYYHKDFRSISAIRIEFIDSIILGRLPEEKYFKDDLARAEKLIKHTWGTAFDNFQEGNVKNDFHFKRVRVVISYGADEDFIKSRIKREVRNCATIKEIQTEEFGNCFEVEAEVINPRETLQWLRSYITRVVSIEIDGEEFNGFIDDVIKTYESYIEPTQKTEESFSSRDGKSLLRDEVPENFVQVDSMHSLLFNEIFGLSFNELGNVLIALMKKGTVEENFKNSLMEDYSRKFTAIENLSKRREQAYNFIFAFLKNSKSVFEFTDEKINKPTDLIPLTSLEKQWLKNILNLPLAKCFLYENEIEEILIRLGEMELFDINKVVLHDQFIGIEQFYENYEFGNTAKEIISAIRDNKKITLEYKSQYGNMSEYLCAPVYFEYSKRDNRIRLQALCDSGETKTFNLERIVKAKITDHTFKRNDSEEIIRQHMEKNERQLVIFFSDIKNVADRILTEFSCFKKKCVKWGNGRYQMTLYYDKEDKREILVRLLSYGSLINIFDDTGDVRHEMIERLKHQLEITNSMELVFATDSEKI